MKKVLICKYVCMLKPCKSVQKFGSEWEGMEHMHGLPQHSPFLSSVAQVCMLLKPRFDLNFCLHPLPL